MLWMRTNDSTCKSSMHPSHRRALSNHQAFRLNHPEAATFTANCNVVLTRAMTNAGVADDCEASDEVRRCAPAAHETSFHSEVQSRRPT